MFAYLNGIVSELNPTIVVIECAGVGYQVHISLQTYGILKQGEQVKLLVHQIVREDAHLLFGFSSEEERRVFRYLISVNGVGANTALLILSSMSISELISGIAQGDENLLKRIKGIGAKTAQRLIVELKDKVLKEPSAFDKVGSSYNTTRQEALSALVVLGFSKPNAEKALDKIIQRSGNHQRVEDLIREALKIL
ncbi:MAG: Holliday junction branch migration protein RuvA [Sphingobacteriia bacterium]|nr:Holliday junction branch migration protein RuvA [Sphingobacteriia bacterium]